MSKILCFVRKIDSLIAPLRVVADKFASPLFDLGARFYLASAFWASAMTRLPDFLNGTFERQIFLFSFEHPVPGVPAELAAHMALGGELILPILLVLGLFGRFAAAGLLIMTAIIEFTYIHSVEHILWAFLAGMIFIKGAGTLSLDTLIRRAIRSRDETV